MYLLIIKVSYCKRAARYNSAIKY